MERQAHIFGVQAWTVTMCLDDFEGDEWRFRPHGMSHALWILGHLLLERKALANILGMAEEISARDQLFEAGTDPDDVPAEVPADVNGAALLAEFGALHGRFVAHLDTLTPGDLGTETDVEFPMTPKTRLGALQFLLMHESYHVGQLGALRVMAGKGGFLKRMAQSG